MLQYIRKVRATFAGGLIVNPGGMNPHDLKIEFNIKKSISSSTNTASISIYNLNESNRNKIGKEFDAITLEAGYTPPGDDTGNVGIIFRGEIRDVEHTRDGSDIVTTISCGDGDKAKRSAKLAKSYPRGTPVEDVVKDLYGEMKEYGVAKGEWKMPDEVKGKTFKRPYAVCGSCSTELDTIGRGNGFYWSIQNETLEIIPGNGYIGGIVVLSPETGLIDVPTITDNGVNASALLNPGISPNRRVRIISQTLDMNAQDKEYRVSEAAYVGDNMTGDFRVDMVCESIYEKKVNEGKKRAKKEG